MNGQKLTKVEALADKKSAVGPSSRKCRTGREQGAALWPASSADTVPPLEVSTYDKKSEQVSNEGGIKKQSVNRSEGRGARTRGSDREIRRRWWGMPSPTCVLLYSI